MPSTPLHNTPRIHPAIFQRQRVGILGSKIALTATVSQTWSIPADFVVPSTPLGSAPGITLPADYTGGTWTCKEQLPRVEFGQPFGLYEEVWEYHVLINA